MTRIRPAAWLMAAVALFLLAVADLRLLVHASPQYYWTQIDTAAYRDGGIVVRNQPAMLYALELGAANCRSPTRPSPRSVRCGERASVARSLAGPGCGGAHDRAAPSGGVPLPGTRRAARRAGQGGGGVCDRRGGPLARPVCDDMFFGQINLVLLALVVGDLALPDRIKGKGIGIGLAAGIKLTPLIFIPYLLFTRRVKARGGQRADLRGHGRTWVRAAAARLCGLLGRKNTRPDSKPFHLDNQSLNGVILRLTHAGPDAHAYWLVAASSSASPARHLDTRRAAWPRATRPGSRAPRPACWYPRSPGRTTTVYVVPALVLAAYGPRRPGYRILGAALVVGLFGWWPLPIGNQGGYDPTAQLLPRGLLLLAPNREQPGGSRVPPGVGSN